MTTKRYQLKRRSPLAKPSEIQTSREARLRYKPQTSDSISLSITPEDTDEDDNVSEEVYIEPSDSYIEDSETRETDEAETIEDTTHDEKFGFRCSIDPIIDILKEIKNKLTDANGISILPRNIPFTKLFDGILRSAGDGCMLNYTRSVVAVKAILTTYDSERKAFKVADKWVQFTPADIYVILGLQITNKNGQIFSKDPTNSDMLQTYFPR
ncbi:hypothetical protein ACHQM5_014043 [Ranunculus cassubicifolius]